MLSYYNGKVFSTHHFGYFNICCTLRSWLHEISALIMTLSPGLEKNFTYSGVPRVFQEWQVCQGAWKTVRNTFQSPNVLQSRRQGPKMCKNKGTNLSRNLTSNRILSRGLENTRTFEWISDSFPGTLTYMLVLENCWNSALMCSFSPIQGTMSWLVLKFHVTRIWELDICGFQFHRSSL